MKRIFLILLIGVFSCSESETIEPIEPIENNKTCYVVVSKGLQDGRFITCDTGLVVGLVEQKLYNSGNYNLYDWIEICATSDTYTFYTLRLSQVICDLSVFTD